MSVTVCRADDEILRLWDAPVGHPRCAGGPEQNHEGPEPRSELEPRRRAVWTSRSPAAGSRPSPRRSPTRQDYLTQLDSAIGDADHGVNMNRGLLRRAWPWTDHEPATVGDVLVQHRHDARVAGGRGVRPALWHGLPRDGQGPDQPQCGGAAAGRRLCGPVWRRYRSLAPPSRATRRSSTRTRPRSTRSRRTWTAAGRSPPRAAAAAAAAAEGMRATTAMQARKGRASYLGARVSVGHQDPGATSTWLIFRSLAEVTAS